MLTERRRDVLAALINEYVAHALPVASRTLVESYPLGVSSATVRNELCALEEEGYIRQPHTSAGRVPTDTGYRSFVDSLLADADLPDTEEAAEAIRRIRERAQAIDELLTQVSSALVELTNCLAVVLPASSARLSMHRIGLSTLMQQPEFSSSLVMLPLLRMIEDNSLLVHINRCAPSDQTSVFIGHENAGGAPDNVSLVATRFGHGEHAGVVALVGPTRMDYGRAISAVRAARCELGAL